MEHTIHPIDQERRRELARRIVQGDAGAIVDLASLYHEAGYRTFARMALAWNLAQAQQHAQVILSAE